jgi:putative membrane protein
LTEANLLPQHYSQLTGEASLWQAGLALMVLGVVLVLLLEWWGRRSAA